MSNALWRSVLLAGSCLVGMSVTQGAQAQTASEPSAMDGEIIVTAQKREQRLQDVPIAITALNAEQLSETGPMGTADLRALVPSMNVTTGVAGFGLPRIRGVGSTGQGPGIENPVAVMVDDVYYGAAFGVLQSLYDVEQVSVLKGPQGTLFGRNATGGVIQIQTRDPEYEWQGSAQVGYGSFETSNIAAFVTGPLSENVAFSLSGQYEDQREGYGVNRFTGTDVRDGQSWAARAKLLFDFSPQTSLLLSFDGNGRDATDPTFRNFTLTTFGADVTDLIENAGGDPNYDIYSDTDPIFEAEQYGASAKLEHDFGDVIFRSVTAYRETALRTFFDPDGTSNFRLRIDNHNFDKQFTEEINLVSDHGGPLVWVVGGFYMWNSAGQEPGRTYNRVPPAFDDTDSDTNTDVRLNSYSLFAEGTYALSEQTNLTAGVRYTIDEREFEAQTITTNINTLVTTESPVISDDRDFVATTWRLSLDHQFTDDVMGYVSYNRGFRSGTFVPQASPVIVLEPEIVDAYEIGLKTTLFDGAVRFNIAAYHYDQENVQVQQVISGTNFVYNADGAEVEGIDADFSWQATDSFRLYGGVGYTDAHYTEFTDAIISIPAPFTDPNLPPGACPGFPPAQDPNTFLGGNCLVSGDASGNRLQNTPELTYSLGVSYDIHMSVGKLTIAGNYYYNDGFVATPDERLQQPSYSTVDGSLTWRPTSEDWFVRLWGRNLTDEFYRTQLTASNSGDNGTFGTPRTYGVSIGVEF